MALPLECAGRPGVQPRRPPTSDRAAPCRFGGAERVEERAKARRTDAADPVQCQPVRQIGIIQIVVGRRQLEGHSIAHGTRTVPALSRRLGNHACFRRALHVRRGILDSLPGSALSRHGASLFTQASRCSRKCAHAIASNGSMPTSSASCTHVRRPHLPSAMKIGNAISTRRPSPCTAATGSLAGNSER